MRSEIQSFLNAMCWGIPIGGRGEGRSIRNRRLHNVCAGNVCSGFYILLDLYIYIKVPIHIPIHI